MSETQQRRWAAQREWLSEPKSDWLTERFYMDSVQPRLGSLTISAIASTLGVSEVYAADIRAGRRRPHPRHWESLAWLVEVSAEAEER